MTDVRQFEADYDGAGPPRLMVRLDCRLVKMPERSIIAVRSFEGGAPAAANDITDIVVGFDAAFHQAMRPLAAWTAESLAAAKETR